MGKHKCNNGNMERVKYPINIYIYNEPATPYALKCKECGKIHPEYKPRSVILNKPVQKLHNGLTIVNI